MVQCCWNFVSLAWSCSKDALIKVFLTANLVSFIKTNYFSSKHIFKKIFPGAFQWIRVGAHLCSWVRLRLWRGRSTNSHSFPCVSDLIKLGEKCLRVSLRTETLPPSLCFSVLWSGLIPRGAFKVAAEFKIFKWETWSINWSEDTMWSGKQKQTGRGSSFTDLRLVPGFKAAGGSCAEPWQPLGALRLVDQLRCHQLARLPISHGC